MMQIPIRSRRPPDGARAELHSRVVVTVALVAAMVVFLQALGMLLPGPRFVARVSVANASPYLVDVSVSDGSRGGWMGLAAVRPDDHLDVYDVVDQGRTWVFRFTSGPYDGGELEISKSQLVRDGWRVTVPRAVIDRLSSRGASPYPG
jgi:hypothetical protein